MSRLVLDTNYLIQIVSPRSKYHSLWEGFVRGEISVGHKIYPCVVK